MVSENGVRNCVHFCLLPLEPLERCVLYKMQFSTELTHWILHSFTYVCNDNKDERIKNNGILQMDVVP